jgi:hypothetical protein
VNEVSDSSRRPDVPAHLRLEIDINSRYQYQLPLSNWHLTVFGYTIFATEIAFRIRWTAEGPREGVVSSGTVLDAELLLWLRAAPRPLGSLFGSFSPRGARSKGDQQPDSRVAHNQKP